ncbi:MAG: hypothetical protein R2698_07020 [Microthrixaceae bacterium]
MVRAVAEAGRRTVSRKELERNPTFGRLSPEVGELDPDAVEQSFDDDPDTLLELLAEAANATDPVLAALARRLAARLVLRLTHHAPGTGDASTT